MALLHWSISYDFCSYSLKMLSCTTYFILFSRKRFTEYVSSFCFDYKVNFVFNIFYIYCQFRIVCSEWSINLE